MLFLITGGSGFLGINLCRYLLEQGHTVRVLDVAPFAYPERNKVDVIIGDVRDRDTVNRAVADVEIIVHAAAALPLSSREDILSTDVEGTLIVLEASFSHTVSRVVFISSTAVYGLPQHLPLREQDTLHGIGVYGEAKVLAEDQCLKFRAAGNCVPVLRPKTFVGPERLGVFELLYNWAFEGRHFPVLGRGDNLYQLLDVQDLCEAIYLCATLDSVLANHTFNVGAKNFGTMRANIQAVLDRAGHGKHVVSLPSRLSVWTLRGAEQLHLSPIYKWIYETATKESYVSIQQIEEALNFVPHYSNEQALHRNYDWYRLHHNEYQNKSGISHRYPWKKGALSLIKYLF